jgi:hypothetical protein
VTQRADGTPYQATVDRMEALYRQRLAQGGSSAEANPFRLAAMKTELAREEMSRLPLAAYVNAWLEGMVVNLGAPTLLDDPRVRALRKPSFYNTPGTSLWQKAYTYLFHDPGRFQVLLVAGLLAMLPFLVLELVGFVMLARTLPWGALFAVGVVGYFLLVNGPVAAPKYRLPMEPVLIVLAAIPLAWLIKRNGRVPVADQSGVEGRAPPRDGRQCALSSERGPLGCHMNAENGAQFTPMHPARMKATVRRCQPSIARSRLTSGV